MAFKPSFDSTALAAVVSECREMIGARLQKVSQPDEHTLVLQTYGRGGARMLLLSCDARFARVHLTTVRPANPQPAPGFCAAARRWTEGGHITAVRQVGFDRIVEVEVRGREGQTYRYVAEVMGKHSNVLLVGPDGVILGAAKNVGPKQSRRQVRAGLRYEPPPTAPRGLDPRGLDEEQLDALARDAGEIGPDWLRGTVEGVGPFLAEALWAGTREGMVAAYGAWRRAVLAEDWEPTLYRDERGRSLGAYPLRIPPPAGVKALPQTGVSAALEAHFLSALRRSDEDALRQELRSALSRARKAAGRAVEEVRRGLAEAEQADRNQLLGELILAYGQGLPPKSATLRAPDYTADGAEIAIPLDPDLTPVENAERYFKRARKARASREGLQERLGALEAEAREIDGWLESLEGAGIAELEEARKAARARGRLAPPQAPPGRPEQRPYEGHRIREVRTPEGILILYGETATANDYLTQRVARPNDWWLHVRGGVSAHAVVPTGNQPDRIPRPALEEAARIVARNSPGKHSKVVAVDYTLRKHVRKPRGAPPGTVLYTHEKTLHVSPERT